MNFLIFNHFFVQFYLFLSKIFQFFDFPNFFKILARNRTRVSNDYHVTTNVLVILVNKMTYDDEKLNFFIFVQNHKVFDYCVNYQVFTFSYLKYHEPLNL